MKAFLVSILAAGAILSFTSPQAPAQGMVLMPDSTNNRLVAFDPAKGSLLTANMFSLTASTTPVNAVQVGNEIWVSEQIGERVSRWSFTGTILGEIGGASGGLDNVRGLALIGNTVYVANAGTNNGDRETQS